MVDFYLISITAVAFFVLLFYMLIDFMRTPNGINGFMNNWTKKTLWIWLPFYAFQRLIKEVILKK